MHGSHILAMSIIKGKNKGVATTRTKKQSKKFSNFKGLHHYFDDADAYTEHSKIAGNDLEIDSKEDLEF